MNTTVTAENSLPFFFGAADEHLFGSYHPVAVESQTALLLCYPLGLEYINGHRAYRQLALRANQAGLPVLRFDYYGTGDSAGEDSDAALSHWLRNIAEAAGELKRRSGASQIILAGLRLGASLAALAAAARQDVSGLLLWEPVVSGQTYLAEVREAHQRRLWYLPAPPETRESAGLTEILGFALSETMYREIEHLDLCTLAQKPANAVFVTEKTAKPEGVPLRATLENLGSKVTYQQIDGPTIWAEDPDKALVPYDVLKAAVQWMVETVK